MDKNPNKLESVVSPCKYAFIKVLTEKGTVIKKIVKE